jgi:RND family efflux transporter MFP subunit
MSEQRNAATPSSRGKVIGILIVCIILAGFGWHFRGAIASQATADTASAQGPGMNQVPDVIVARVETGVATPPREYVGHVEPMQLVAVQAQIDGYIETVHFEEGSLVKEGDLLFTIQQDRYKAQVALNEAALAQAKANLARAEKYYKRLQNADERSVVQATLDTAESDLLQCKAQVQQAKANLDLSKINLGYTEIHSPITGRIGKAVVTKGNFVSPATGPLAHIVQVDPIRVIFSMTDREYFKVTAQHQEDMQSAFNARLRLPDGQIYTAAGKWDFEDNQMNPQTGTIAIRSKFDNAKGILVPQTYVTVILQANENRQASIVPMQAVMNDAQGSYVYVVGKENIAERRSITLGAQTKAQQIVESGLSAGETIIVTGMEKVRAGQKVNVQSNVNQAGSELSSEKGA